MDYKATLIDILKEVPELKDIDLEPIIEIPSDETRGDFAMPCFVLAKTMHNAPQKIAEDLQDKLDIAPTFEKVVAVGPYLNFFIAKNVLVKNLVKKVEDEGDEFGKSNMGEGKSVVIDYSSPNIAKPFHIGHIRSTLIGNAIYRISKRLGFDVTGVNHLGDYGTQFGMLITAYKKWGDKEAIEKNPIDEFLKLYVKINKEIEEDPEKRELAHEWFRKLENNDKEAKEIWQWMRDLSIKEFKKVYERLDIKFESYNGEAFYQDKIPSVIEELHKKNLLVEDDGCEIVDLKPYGLTPLIITKSNGTSTYATRDIATAEYRKETYDFYKNIYVVATEQNLHFKQLFKTLELMGYEWAKDCVHVGFGMVSIEDGSLSTRKGKVLYLVDVLNKAVEKTLKIIEERNPELQNKEEVASKVGIGAIKFQELYNQRIKDYVFDWDKTLSFEGETGPYVQYTYARANSVIEKSGITPSFEDIKVELINEDELKLFKEINKLPRTLVDAFEKFEPYLISRQLMQVVKEFNRYYYNNPFISEDKNLTKHRIAIAELVKTVIKSQLSLLGIKTVERM
ncbi:MAG: arginine--tRNA ligase [Ezakiella sp.]|nr:arginine--tRNA ligase [Ezakiella sp.]MDD7471580.1 arginine--tRNA ligase [Bacillota bacterium]MDY3922816.1 arginine--tRNA ligase [Ezakiella sp.]